MVVRQTVWSISRWITQTMIIQVFLHDRSLTLSDEYKKKCCQFSTCLVILVMYMINMGGSFNEGVPIYFFRNLAVFIENIVESSTIKFMITKRAEYLSSFQIHSCTNK